MKHNDINSDRLKKLIKQYEEVDLFATNRLETIISETIAPLNIEHFKILRMISLKGPHTSTTIANSTYLHKSTVSIKSEQLVELGLLERTTDSEDRRRVYLHLTDAGHAFNTKADEQISTFISPYLQELEPEELEVFVRVYDKISRLINQSKLEEEK